MALVELLAYTGDALSYHQDAVATEAYLGTARRRISLRRHARLLDYRMHSGCNARAWVVLETGDAEGATIDAQPDDPAQRVVLLTRGDVETGNPNVPAEAIAEMLALERPVVFEPLSDLTLRASHDKISFYTWSDAECCLPAGSTRATLVDNDGLAAAARRRRRPAASRRCSERRPGRSPTPIQATGTRSG